MQKFTSENESIHERPWRSSTLRGIISHTQVHFFKSTYESLMRLLLLQGNANRQTQERTHEKNKLSRIIPKIAGTTHRLD